MGELNEKPRLYAMTFIPLFIENRSEISQQDLGEIIKCHNCRDKLKTEIENTRQERNISAA